MNLCCGHEDEWAFLEKQYKDALGPLTVAHDTVLQMLQQRGPEGTEENVLYLLAAACLKEFEEILLLAGNGYGSGSLKLLRALYERVSTLGYLAKKPAKIDQFVGYTDIHWHKLLVEAERIHSDTDLEPLNLEKLRANFEASKERYMETDSGGKKRLQLSWTKKPVPDQASEVSDTLRQLCFNAYLRPTFYLHTTYIGTVWQCKVNENGKVQMYGTEVEHETARTTLPLAHLLLIQTAEIVNGFFKLGKEIEVTDLANQWSISWDKVPKKFVEEG